MTKKELIKFLRYVKRNGKITRLDLQQYLKNGTVPPEFLHNSSALKLGARNQPIYNPDDFLILSEKAIDYLDDYKRDVIRTWFPNTIATIALIISIISIVLHLLK